MAERRRSPYRFLDPYGEDDRRLFFGRGREIETLVSDIVLSRLVILFARTGTGKTSLLNAGVRPELQRRGFETFFVRVRAGDPAAAVRSHMERHSEVGALDGDSLDRWLANAAERLERPIAVFFDQFEEFFLYTAKQDPAAAHKFIKAVAASYRDRGSGVHLVFSLREDFYVELDLFRDEIPTIFSNDSNLRLRWFDPAQARDAIVKPAEVDSGVTMEEELVDALIGDLSARHSLVEPAQLQIVCDTLWGDGSRSRLTLADYRALGQDESSATIVEQVLNRRLEQQFRVFETREELAVLEALLSPGTLDTERGTKYVRDIASLEREMAGLLESVGAGPEVLASVLGRLEEARLINRFVRDDLTYVELTHDYLVAEPERLAELRTRVHDMWPRKVLARPDAAPGDLEEVLDRVADEWEAKADGLSLSAAEAERLLRVALHRGLRARAAYAVANARGVDALALVAGVLEHGPADEAANAVELLAEFGTPGAVKRLERAFGRPDVAVRAVRALERVPTTAAVDALAGAMAREELADEAQRCLTLIANAAHGTSAGARAVSVLVEYLGRPRDDPAADRLAMEDLGRIEAGEAVEALATALARPGPVAGDAEASLRRLARSSREEVSARAAAVLKARHKPPPSPDAGETPAFRRAAPVSESDLVRIARAFGEDRVVPFLGPGLYGPRVTGVRDLRNEDLEAILSAEPTAVHRFLASLPDRLSRMKYDPAPSLIVTVDIDEALERGFAEAGYPFDLVSYLPDAGRFTERTVSARLTIVRAAGGDGRYLVADDDFTDFLLGDTLWVDMLRRSHLLFVGASVADWRSRVMVRRLVGGRLKLRSWAIAPEPGPDAEREWRRLDVEVFDSPLEEFVDRLSQQVDRLGSST